MTGPAYWGARAGHSIWAGKVQQARHDIWMVVGLACPDQVDDDGEYIVHTR